MGHTFVSYARSDESFVNRLMSALRDKGLSLWSDDRIAPGDHYDDVIDAALEAADKVLVVWSASSVQSQWVRAEASEGLKRHVLIPITIDRARIPLEFRRLQTIDFSSWNGDRDAPELRTLTNALIQPSPDPNEASNELPGEPVATPAPKAHRISSQRLGKPLLYALLGSVAVTIVAVAIFVKNPRSAQPTLAVVDVQSSTDVPESLPLSLQEELAAALGNDSRLALVQEGVNERAGSDFALATTVRKSDDQLRFTFNLLDATRKRTLLSQQIDLPSSQAAIAPRQAATAVGSTLLCGLAEQGKSTRLNHPALTARLQLCKEEYEEQLALDGLYALSKRVTDLAPQSAKAWADRAYYASTAVWAGDAAARQDVIYSAKRALEIDPKNSLVYGAYAELLPRTDFLGREKLLRKGVAACSIDCSVELHGLGWFLLDVGRVNEGSQALLRALDIEPNPDIANNYADALFASGRYVEARDLLFRTLSRWPQRDTLRWALLRAALASKRYDEARALIRSELGVSGLASHERAAWLATLDALESGAPDKINAAAESTFKLSQSLPTASVFNVVALSQLGRGSQALQAALAIVEYDRLRQQILFWQILDGSRLSPNLNKYFESAGLIAYWRASKKLPDFCSSGRDADLCKELR